jgi:hypothetical protein
MYAQFRGTEDYIRKIENPSWKGKIDFDFFLKETKKICHEWDKLIKLPDDNVIVLMIFSGMAVQEDAGEIRVL